MKSIYTKIVLLVLFTFTISLSTVFGQVPQAINFQAIARDGSGNPMVNTNIQIRLSVVDSAQSGTIVYQELRALQTNAYGSFSFLIGVNPSFTTIGTFPAVNWETGNKHLKIDYDPTNTFTFNLSLGTIRFVTVPYAFAAETVVFIDATGAQNGDALVYNSTTGKFEPGQVSVGTVNWTNIQNKPTFATVATSGSYTDLTNTPVINGSETKVQAGANVTVTGTGTTASPYIVNSTATGSIYTAGSGIIITGNTISAKDTSSTNELQTLSIRNDTIFLTNGGFVKLPTSSSSTLLPPVATATAASDVLSFSATLNGTVNAKGLSTTVVFEWGLTTAYGNNTNAAQSPVTGVANVAVSKALTGLQSNTTYHYRIKATNAVDVTYSNDLSFTTPLSAPQLTTNSITSITGISAISGGNITYDGGSAVTARGVCWSTNPAPTLSNSFSSNGTGSGSYTSNIISLALGTTYYVCAYATNAVGTTYGNVLSFTTVALPTITTAAFSNIKGNSAKAGGAITNTGGSTITSQGLCWSTSATPTIANSVTTSFTADMTVLSPNTTYYVRAYATNVAGTGYGNQISFNSGRLIGSTYGGGLVFYNDGSSHGLVCADTDQSTGAAWGCEGTAIGGTSTAINTGAANTNAIVAGCTTAGIAAKLCYDLVLNTYSDWYLPSKDELNLMYVNLKTQSLGSFDTYYYWSSSESDASYTWDQSFVSGYQSNTNVPKSYTKHVRAVRAF